MIDELQSGTKVLILAPHTDDGEFGCGATIAKLIERNAEVHYAAFSLCEQSVPGHLPSRILEEELNAACDLLGIHPEARHIFGYRVRHFPQYRQDILEDLVKLKQKLQPELVFLPATSDTHQDHQVISHEGFRAFKDVTILGYEMPWNNMTFTTTCFSVVSEAHVDAKINAMTCYQSQAQRTYASADFVRSLAMTRGVQVRARYAEAFEVIRLMLQL